MFFIYQRLVKGNPELHPLHSGARVWMRSVHHHLRIHAQRNRRVLSQLAGDDIETLKLLF
jgi:hypothetical protein